MNGRRVVQGAVVGVFLAGAAVAAFAKPAFMDRYNADPYAKAAMHNKCTVCHIGHGGGERNDFGEAFADSGFRITPKLRAKFPDLFESAPASERSQDPQKP
jgi:hypothetical protein